MEIRVVAASNETQITNTMKEIKMNGRQWKIRYSYQREDGTLWHVIDTQGENGPFLGEFGDEWPA